MGIESELNMKDRLCDVINPKSSTLGSNLQRKLLNVITVF